MANISAELAAIQAAILGEQVRGSIHDAIDVINRVSERIFLTGTTDPVGNAMYSKLLYLNTTTWDLFQSADTSPYVYSKIGNIEGNGIASITGPVADPSNPLVDEYTINFTKLATPVTFYVAKGKGIVSIDKTSVSGLVDTYTITYNDGTTKEYDVTNGKGIVNITGPTSVGLADTYTINYNDGTNSTFIVNNGKNGCTWLHGTTEISGKARASTGYTLLNDDCQKGDMYFNDLEGAIYVCDVGAVHGAQSYWSCTFVISGGGGGVSYLYLLTDVDQTTVEHPVNGQILQFNGTTGKWEAKDGGSGHTMKPVPSSHPTEADVVSAINTGGLDDTNVEVASLYGISKWSNKKTFRAVLPGSSGAIGHYGVGEWKWTLNNPSAVDEANWGWWQNDIFKYLGDQTLNGYDVDFKIKFVKDPGSEEILLGGYIVDTVTGYMCIKFANYVCDIVNATIVVDVTFTRNDITVVA